MALGNNKYKVIEMSYLKYLTFQDPRLRLTTLQFSSAPNKLLKISTSKIGPKPDSECFRSKSPSLLLNPSTLLWKQKLIVMVGAVKRLDFEIADVHTFGYSPGELSGVLTGTIEVFPEREKLRSWDVVDGHGRKVGVLTATVVDQFHVENRGASVVIKEVAKEKHAVGKGVKEIISYQPVEKPKVQAKQCRHFITIYSVVGNLSKQVPKMESSFIEVQAGSKKVRTSQSKGNGTQNAWVDTLKFITSQGVNQLQFFFYGCEGDEEQILYKGSLSLEIFEQKKRIVSHRIQLTDKDGPAGELFVDIRCTSDEDNSAFKDNIVKRLQISHRYTSVPNKDLKTLDSGRKSTQRSSVSPSSTKHSVVIPNNSILFSKQRRFASYNDKQNPIISYLASSQMFDPKSKSHYRGASIGLGDKSDFTRSFKSNPGVGEYKLPSIWDRY